MADLYGQIAAELDKAIDMRDRYKAALESCEAVLGQRNAQLAAVKAMCHQTGGGPDAWLYVVDVLAVLSGEGDRG